MRKNFGQTAAMDAGISIADVYMNDTDSEEVPITLDDMFADKVFKVYLEIDFLGRL